MDKVSDFIHLHAYKRVKTQDQKASPEPENQAFEVHDRKPSSRW